MAREQVPPAQEPFAETLEVPRGPETVPLRENAFASATNERASRPAIRPAERKLRISKILDLVVGALVRGTVTVKMRALVFRDLNLAFRDVESDFRFVSFCTSLGFPVDFSAAKWRLAIMEQDAKTILVIDDDPEIRRLVSDFLGREGYAVEQAEDGRAMDRVLEQVRPDLVVLDLMLPGEDGLSICRRLRGESDIPILMLTAKGDETDRVVGLEIGADDYVVKPFGPRELLARIRALLRRSIQRSAQQITRRFAFDRFVADLDARQLLTDEGDLVALTSAEFDLLACFVMRPRRVLSRDQILDWTHGRSADPFDRTVDILVSRLRKKLDSLNPGCNLINTARNGGYLLTVPVRQVP